jgi:hypothetical protein
MARNTRLEIGMACQVQTLKLLFPIRKSRRKLSVVNVAPSAVSLNAFSLSLIVVVLKKILLVLNLLIEWPLHGQLAATGPVVCKDHFL